MNRAEFLKQVTFQISKRTNRRKYINSKKDFRKNTRNSIQSFNSSSNCVYWYHGCGYFNTIRHEYFYYKLFPKFCLCLYDGY